MGKVVLFKNNKGGVGKSLLTFWTAHAMTTQLTKKFKILILTSDSQNNILHFAGIKNNFGKGLEDYIEKGNGELIRLRENLMYIPLTTTKIKSSFEKKFVDLIEVFKKQYDYIFIDGSPVLELDNVFIKISDSIVIPSQMEYASVSGVINVINNSVGSDIAAIVPNMFTKTRIEKEYYENLIETVADTKTKVILPINQSAFIGTLTEKGKTIWETKSKKADGIKESLAEIVGVIY